MAPDLTPRGVPPAASAVAFERPLGLGLYASTYTVKMTRGAETYTMRGLFWLDVRDNFTEDIAVRISTR